MRQFQLLAPSDIPEGVRADAMWKAGPVVGTLQIVELNGTKLEDVPAFLIASDVKSCKGEFFSGSVPDEARNQPVARVFTGCRSKNATATIYYVSVPRPKGGFYLFGTLSDGRGGADAQPAKDADTNIRKAVFEALPKT